MNNLLKNIKFEKDYTKFHFLQSNRIVDPKHTTKMSNSLNNMEAAIRPVVCINTNVVDGKKKLYIIDGQHLFYALMKVEAEIPYIILEVTNMKDMIYKMALLNNSSKSWGLLDYIVAYKAVDIDYQILFELNLKYSIELNMLTAICLNVNSASMVGSIIKDGSFKNLNKNYIEMCDKFQEIFVNVGTADRWIKHSFFTAFMMNYNKYKHSETVENITKNISTVKMMTTNDNVKNFINNLFIK